MFSTMSDLEIEDEPKISLVEPISRSALIGAEGVCFSVTDADALNRDDLLLRQPEDEFDPEELLKTSNLDVINGSDSNTADTPFESIKKTMTKVTEDGRVMKRIKVKGIGDVIAPNSYVTIHYNGYEEMREVPFDSSSLRGKPFSFPLGDGFLPGLDTAIRTMRVRERSEFLLHPSVAYGKLGCAPRIQPNAEVLFDVELLSARAGVEAEVENAISRDEKTPWINVRKAVKAYVSQGIDHFNKNQMRDSKIRFERAKNLLTRCSLKDEKEEEAMKAALLKVCSNLAFVYNELHDHPSNAPNAISNCKEALEIDPYKHRLHLPWGVALTNLGDYVNAERHLSIARKHFPHDTKVLKACENLEEKIKREKATEREMWARAFKQNGDNREKKEQKETSQEYNSLIKMFESLKCDPSRKSVVLPKGVTGQEHDEILNLAEQYGFSVDTKSTSFLIMKP